MSGEPIEQTQTPILRMQGVHKSFGSRCLTSVSFESSTPGLHGLLGGNELENNPDEYPVRIVPDGWEIFLHDQRVEIHSPKDAIELRIGRFLLALFLQVKPFRSFRLSLGSPTRNKLAINLDRRT